MGSHKGKIEVYDGDTNLQKVIPVNMDVKSTSSDECYLSTTFLQYAQQLKKGASSYTESYTFIVSPQCDGGIDITDIYVSGQVTMTESGYVPIRLSGGIPKGHHNAGSSFKVNLEFDSAELSLGTYATSLIVGGIWNGNTISEKIDYDITVVGQATPLPDTITSPDFDKIPEELVLNETYTITARNVNPNIDVRVGSNEFITGESVKLDGSNWIYTFKPNKVGATTIKVWAEYKGGQIGNIYEQNIKIKPSAGATIGDKIKFKFYPELSKLKDGSKLDILVIDETTNNTIPKADLELFVNGVACNGSIIVKKDTQYDILASVMNYPGINKIFTVNPKYISLSYEPFKPKVGDTITFTTEPVNATLLYEDNEIAKAYTFTSNGIFKIIAQAEGYVDSEFNITIGKLIELIHSPNSQDKDNDGMPELKKGEKYYFEFNEDTNSSVIFKDEKGGTTTISNGGKTIDFEVNEKGEYSIQAEGNTIATYEVSGFYFNKYYLLIVVGVACLLIFLMYARKVGRDEEVDPATLLFKREDVNTPRTPEDFEGE